jgi:uncharacterized protein YcbX
MVGYVAALWRYPVKSMLGEELDVVEIESRGVVGDRSWAVRTPEGKFGSGKTTRRFERVDGLFDYRASYAGETPCIRLPSGVVVRGDEPDVDTALSTAAGRPLVLAREADVSHFDSAPVHVMTTSSLRWLGTCLGDRAADARRFRPNIVLETEGDDRLEDGWLDRTLSIGEVELRVVARTKRCVMTTLPQEELASDPEVLKTLARENDACLGVYAEVLRPGIVRIGDGAEVR